MRSRTSSESGFILIAVAFVVLLMGGLASTLLIEMHGAKKAVDHQETSLQALQLVELGIVRSELEVFSLTDAGTDGVGNVTGNVKGQPYSVSAAPHASVANRWTLTGEASHDLSRRRVEVGIRRRGGGAFMEGLYSKDTLTLNGVTVTDSYDSRLGTYASQAVNNDGGGTYANTRGHVGSGMDIVVHGSSVRVRGNAIPGQDSEVLQSGSPTIVGDTLPRTQDVDLPDTPLADFVNAMNNNNNASIVTNTGSTSTGGSTISGGSGGNGGNGNNANNGNTSGGNTGGNGGSGAYNAGQMSLQLNGNNSVTLSAGTYFFTDVSVTGQGKIRVTGPVKIYVTGSFDLSGGGLVNASGVPSDVQIFAHPYPLPAHNPPNNTQVKLRGGAVFAGTVYAPETDVTMMGGTDYFGAVVGRRITIGGNFEFHYDEALGDMGGSSKVMLERLYWRELAVPRR